MATAKKIIMIPTTAGAALLSSDLPLAIQITLPSQVKNPPTKRMPAKTLDHEAGNPLKKFSLANKSPVLM
mgnify:CR=1